MLLLSYYLNGKKNGVSAASRGVRISGANLWKTILLALSTVGVSYLLVFLGDWLFETDCRIWVIALRAFKAVKLIEVAKYLPFFLIYYIILSISVNTFNYVKMGKRNWVNICVEICATVAGPLLFYAIQYITMHSTGYLWTELQGLGSGSVILGIWVYPLLFWLPAAVLVSRAIYKKTNNPYLGGIIMALLVTLANCTNTITFI